MRIGRLSVTWGRPAESVTVEDDDDRDDDLDALERMAWLLEQQQTLIEQQLQVIARLADAEAVLPLLLRPSAGERRH